MSFLMKVQNYKSKSRYSLCQNNSHRLPTKLYSLFKILDSQLLVSKTNSVKTNFFFVRFTGIEKQFDFNVLSFFCFTYFFYKNKKNWTTRKPEIVFSTKVYSNAFFFESFFEKEILKAFVAIKKMSPFTEFSRSNRKVNKNGFVKKSRFHSKISWFRFFSFFYYNDCFFKNNNKIVNYWNHFTTKNLQFSFKKTRTHNFFSSPAFKNKKFKAKRKNWKKEILKKKYTIHRRSNYRKKLKRSFVYGSFLQNNTLYKTFNSKTISVQKLHNNKKKKYSKNRFFSISAFSKKLPQSFFPKKKYTFKIVKKNFKKITNQNSFELEKKNSFSFFYSSSRRKGFSKNKKKASALIQHKERETILINVLGTSVTLYRINALSFARFAFDWERKEKKRKEQTEKKEKRKNQNASVLPNFSNLHERYLRHLAQKNRELNLFLNKKQTEKKQIYNKGNKIIKSSKFLKALENERRRRYRYIGVYIQDLIRLSFVSFYFKYAAFLIRFFAFTLRKLPRNRKETKYLRFLIKLVKVFGAQREEIVGLRVRFQGRVNRWRRTKHILGQKGILPLHTYTARVAYGYAQAITRKGAFGRRLWIAYEPYFAGKYKQIFFQYFQTVGENKITRFTNESKI